MSKLIDWGDDDDDDSGFSLSNATSIQATTNTKEMVRELSRDPLNALPKQSLLPAELRALERLHIKNAEISIIDTNGKRLEASDKRIIGGTSDINQIIPFKHEWAWQKYLNGCNNHWMPQEVPMSEDIRLWKSDNGLTEDERWVIMNSLGFFATADSIVANNLVLAIYGRITSPECRQYLLRQAFEEGLHTHSYQYCIESLGIDQGQIFNLYRENPSMVQKDNWCLKYEKSLIESAPDDYRTLLRDLVAFYIVMEGIFFYAGFSMVLSMGRRRKMIGVAEQFQYIMRDESNHLNFGIDVINTIRMENPGLWDKELEVEIRDMIIEGGLLETSFANDILPNGIEGMTVRLQQQYLRFIVDRRLLSLGLEPEYNVTNPLPWMAEMIDIRKEKNFFETR